MYQYVKKTKVLRRYVEALSLHTGAPTLHWEDNTSCISIVEAKKVTTTVKNIDILVCFLQDHFDNGLFIPKYEKSSVMPADMCTKPCSDPIISQSNKWINGFILYTTSDTENYQFIILHKFIVK